MYRLYTCLIVLSLLPLPVWAEPDHEAVRGAICSAAQKESALPGQMDPLLEGGMLDHDQSAGLLSMECADGRSLIEIMVDGMQAENLEYMVVDLNLDPAARNLELDGERLSVNDVLRERADRGEPRVAQFARDYLEWLGDERFNPSMMVQKD